MLQEITEYVNLNFNESFFLSSYLLELTVVARV